VLFPDELKISRSLRKKLRADTFEVSFDRAFEAVIERCAEPRQAQGRIESGTWITPAMRAAYCRLHELGFAHSVETWQGPELVGGLYGVSLGAMFFGESMFTRATDASKVALVGLVGLAKTWHFSLIDCQVANPHLASLGARTISRKDFLARVRDNLTYGTHRGSWREERPADP
jgi:leucyl/phenylalanyl-tRNA--protein transferase